MNINFEMMMEEAITHKEDVDKIFDEFITIGGAQKISDLMIYGAILKMVNPENILEFSTAEGLTTSVIVKTMNKFNLRSNLLAFDYDDTHVEKSKSIISKYDTSKTKIFKHSYYDKLETDKKFEVIFIDGFHSKKDGEAIIKMIQPLVSDKFILFVHDIGWDQQSSNPHNIISPYDEWQAWIEFASNSKLSIFFTAQLINNSKYKNYSWRSSRALLDSPASGYLGHSMILSNYISIQ